MNTTIRLIDGLEIQFADDGTWLHFDGGNRKTNINLESYAADKSLVISGGIKEWCERARNFAFVK